MNNLSLREVILGQFIEPPAVIPYFSYKTLPSKQKGKTLADFYQEVFQKNTSTTVQSFEGKNAHDIELIMMQNLKSIEAKKRKR